MEWEVPLFNTRKSSRIYSIFSNYFIFAHIVKADLWEFANSSNKFGMDFAETWSNI